MNAPYFKFFVNDWMSGKIRYLSLEDQGIYINLICLIWKNGGIMQTHCERIAKALATDMQTVCKSLASFKELGILDESETGELSIKFVSEQYQTMNKKSELCSKAANKRHHANAMRTQCERNASAYIIQNSESDIKKNIKKNFKTWTLDEFIEEVHSANSDGALSADEERDFVGYWEEKSTSGKTRRSMEKTWDTRRRIMNAISMVYSRRRENVQPSLPISDYDPITGRPNKCIV